MTCCILCMSIQDLNSNTLNIKIISYIPMHENMKKNDMRKIWKKGERLPHSSPNQNVKPAEFSGAFEHHLK